jgi:hypothetical protein
MKSINAIIILFLTLLFSRCITQFIPETTENQELLVVEGLVTDQPEPNIVKLSKSMPLGKKSTAIPLSSCSVYISDDIGNSTLLYQTEPGTYATDPSTFRGKVGRKYTLKIFTNSNTGQGYSYESLPMEMKPVPPIDSIYYEKILLHEATDFTTAQEGCQIYFDTHDEADNCKFYRWDFTETWEIRLPFSIPVNRVCWIIKGSSVINIKNTSILSENVIRRFPLNYITYESDRLKEKYSILLNQYSVNQDEYDYWEKLQNFTEEVGGLYDIIPASIPSNISCIENPAVLALGYFSVSALSSKRIMIDENFSGIVNFYSDCISDTVYNGAHIPYLGSSVWILEDRTGIMPPYKVLTDQKGCADCTVRGTKNMPPYWNDYKKKSVKSK